MGLDVIGEDEEEGEENEEEDVQAREGRWFEDLMSSLGEEDFAMAEEEVDHEWTESEVACAIDEGEYEEDAMEVYTLPSSPTSPRSPISHPLHAAPIVVPTAASVSPAATANVEDVEVAVVTVELDMDECDELDNMIYAHSSTTPSQPSRLHGRFGERGLAGLVSTPVQPIRALPECEDEDDVDDFYLPPPLVRSFSASSDTSMLESECTTPPGGSCEELEEEAPDRGVDVSVKDLGMSMSLSISMDEPAKRDHGKETECERLMRMFGANWLGLSMSRISD
jgi:hypothetical protein